MKQLRTLKRWMSEPLVLPRWMLYVFYLLFFFLGISMATKGNAPIEAVTSETYVLPYGLAVGAAGLIALIGAFFPAHPSIESLGGFLLVSLLALYVVATFSSALGGDPSRVASGLIVLIAVLLPLFRFTVLVNTIASKRGQS